MPSPFSKIGKKLKDSLLTPAEDPRQKFVSTFEKQRLLLDRVRSALAEVALAKGRLESKAMVTSQKLPKLESLARQALLDDREDLARLRLRRRHLAQAQLQALNKQLMEIEQEEQRLSLTEQRLSDQLAAFYTQQEVIAARYSAAEAQMHISEALAGVSSDLADLSQAMSMAEQKSAQMQARVAAIDRLVDEGLLESPETAVLTRAEEIVLQDEAFDLDAELAALRASMEREAASPAAGENRAPKR